MKNKLNFFICFIASIILPSASIAQAPTLGTTSTFALFTATGAFGNTGSTTITGDVGTNAGAFTGSPTVNGQTHVADGTSSQAATDVSTAYSDLNNLSCDSTIGTTLGSGQVLTARIYCLGGVSSLNGELVLDGQGDSNALFIFKIDGAFSTSTFSSISLANNARLYNVYWQVNGAFTLGDSSTFRGTIINNGAISLSSGASLFGRGLSVAGAIALNNNEVIVGTQANFPLPVKLVSFLVEKDNRNTSVNLTWQTASELNADYFLIERSVDGRYFETIGQLKAAGNSNRLTSYLFNDEHPKQGINYYRLKQVDFDGTQEQFPVRSVLFDESTQTYGIYPNPFISFISIRADGISPANTFQLRIYNPLLQLVWSTTLTNEVTSIQLSELPTGVYFYQLMDAQYTVKQSGKLMKE